MEGERYVGERRALRHFLQELRPLVVTTLGRDSVLAYRIDQALRTADLASLRRARQVFHNQPEDLKRRLMRGIFQAPPTRPSKDRLLETYSLREPEPFIRFDAYPAARRDDIGITVEIDHELADDVPVRVLVSPDTLPTSAAVALREIASWIERDRRLLSKRHWRLEDGKQHHAGRFEERPEPSSDSADQA